MRTAHGQPVRLEDYRVPDFLVDSVELDISLDRHATRVVATLAVRPHPQGRADAALAFDGDELELVSAALDGAALGVDAYEASPLASRCPTRRAGLSRCASRRVSIPPPTPS